MAQMIRNVIVVGASGTVGAHIFKALVASSKFNVSVLSRPESTNTYAPNTRVFESDYSEATLLEAFEGQDAVISVLGAAAFAEETKLVDAAVKAGVKRFLPSAFSVNSASTKAAEVLPLLGLKLRTSAHLKEQESKGLTWTSIETGAAFDFGAQFGLLGFNINTKEAVIFGDGNKAFSTANMSQIGNAVIAVLLNPEETANQHIYIDSFTTTQNQILAEFEKATGEKWKVTKTTLGAAQAAALEALAKGDFAGALGLLRVITFGEGFGSDFTKDGELANGKLRLPKQDLVSTVAGVVAGKTI